MPLEMAFITSDGSILAGHTNDGTTWTHGGGSGTPGFANSGQSSKATPSATLNGPSNDESFLVAFIDSTNNLSICAVDGASGSYPIVGHRSKAGPSLLALDAAGKSDAVWLAFVRDTTYHLQVMLGSEGDPGNFSPTPTVNQVSRHGPSLALFNGTIWMAFVGIDDDNILVCSLEYDAEGLTGWSGPHNTGHYSKAAPSLVAADVGSGLGLWLAYLAHDPTNCSCARRQMARIGRTIYRPPTLVRRRRLSRKECGATDFAWDTLQRTPTTCCWPLLRRMAVFGRRTSILARRVRLDLRSSRSRRELGNDPHAERSTPVFPKRFCSRFRA